MKHIFTILVLCFLCSLLISCNNVEKKNIISVLNYWKQHEILFPKNMIFTIQGKDTVDYSMDGDYKILSYIDSSGCVSCRLKLKDWMKFMSEATNIFDSMQVNFLFFFTPKKIDEIRYMLSLYNFDHPVCIDPLDSINILNAFPPETMYHTFLLDKDDKVVAIGNPINNPQIKELYLKIFKGEELSVEVKKKRCTDIILEKTHINLGYFDWYEEQVANFVITNTGKELLIIDNVVSSCGCTKITYEKEPVKSGKSLIFTVKYQAEHPEHFNKTITVYCNTKDSPIQLTISGNAK